MSKHVLNLETSHVTISGDFNDSRLDQPNIVSMNSDFRKSKKWKKVSGTHRELFECLLNHKVGSKEGSAFVPGELAGTQRASKAMKNLHFMTLDVDNGYPIQDLVDRINDMDLMAIIYTTHSSGSTNTQVHEDKIVDLYGENYSDQNVLNYLEEVREFDQSVLVDAIVSSKTEHTANGIMINISHQPMEKCRVVIPLLKQFCFAERNGTHKDAIVEWKNKYMAFGKKLDLKIDTACQDPARLYYLPRHAKNSAFEAHIIIGNPLDIEAVKVESTKQPKPNKIGKDKALAKPLKNSKAYKTKWLKRLMDKCATSFDAEGFFTKHCEKRRERSGGNGWHFECPNDSSHNDAGNPDDGAFFAVSATNNDGGSGPVAQCMHKSCKDLKTFNFIDIVIQANKLEAKDVLEFCNGDDDGSSYDDVDLPCGCYYGTDGIYMPIDKDKSIRLCGKFHFIGKASNPDGTGHSIIIQTEAGVIVHSLKSLHEDNKTLICELADKGITVPSSSKPAFTNMLSQVPDMDLPEGIIAEQSGYIGNHYVLPSGVVIGEPPDKYILKRLPNTAAWKHGDLDGWKAMAHKAWKEGNDLMRFTLLLSGAAMLSNFLGEDGFVFATTGSSSTGKTTALKLAASFFGKPGGGEESTFVKLKGTENAMEGTFERLSGVLSSCDELSMFDGNIQNLVFMINGGKGKLRANQRGDVRKPKSFHSAAFISSEVGIVDMLTRSGGKAAQGMNVRCFDIDVSNIDPVDEDIFNEIVSGFNANYGHACEVFANELLNRPQNDLFAEISSVADAIIKNQSSSGDYSTYLKRSVRNFGLLEAAGHIMVECDLIPKNKDSNIRTVVEWAWLNSAGDPTKKLGNPAELAMDVLRENLITKKGIEFVDVHVDDTSRYKEPKAYYSIDKKKHIPSNIDAIGYMPRDVLIEWSGGTCKISELTKELKRLGVLIIPSGKNLIHSTIPGEGKYSHYRIDLTKFAYEEELIED